MNQHSEQDGYTFHSQGPQQTGRTGVRQHSGGDGSSGGGEMPIEHDDHWHFGKTKQGGGLLGSPLNHPRFEDYKSGGAMARDGASSGINLGLGPPPPPPPPGMATFNAPNLGNFDAQRQYMTSLNFANPPQLYSTHTFQHPQSSSSFYADNFLDQVSSTTSLGNMESMMPMRSMETSGKFSFDSKVSTPVESGSTSASGEFNANRKRLRKSDYAVPGDEGDNELKQLALKVAHLPLANLAIRIKSVENDNTIPETKSNYASSKDTSKERQRQIFGMVWLLNSCEASPTAVVPRNRIYARYVQLCADNSLKPLSPASFGKLVRLSFPNLTTRRLGMRGQSKYHYCGIKLVGDQNIHPTNSPLDASSPVKIESPQSNLPNTPSLTSSPQVGSYSVSTTTTPLNTSLSNELQVLNLKYVPNLFGTIDSTTSAESSSAPFTLPSIYPYLPKDCDYDIADTLYSLNKVHSTSTFESLRFMQVKKLLSSFSSFSGILTVPVFKLYVHESILPWVEACDTAMYKAMVKMITKLQFHEVPEDVLQQLKLISAQFTDKLTASLVNKVPKEFMNLKLNLARRFVMILNRLIKVIETGKSLINVLKSGQPKKTMVEDWRQLDITEIVLREVPCSKDNIEILLKVVKDELVQHLNIESMTELQWPLSKLAQFLNQLPSRFTDLNPRLFTLISGNFLTACLREISLRGGQSFGSWWILRCWIDEYLSWNFEVGGYLQDEFDSFEDVPFKNISGVNLQESTSSNKTNNALLISSSNEPLQTSSLVDLLDGAYGANVSKDEQIASGEVSLTYDHVGVEAILGRSDDILN